MADGPFERQHGERPRSGIGQARSCRRRLTTHGPLDGDSRVQPVLRARRVLGVQKAGADGARSSPGKGRGIPRIPDEKQGRENCHKEWRVIIDRLLRMIIRDLTRQRWHCIFVTDSTRLDSGSVVDREHE